MTNPEADPATALGALKPKTKAPAEPAAVTGADITLDDAVAQANAWLVSIESSTS